MRDVTFHTIVFLKLQSSSEHQMPEIQKLSKFIFFKCPNFDWLVLPFEYGTGWDLNNGNIWIMNFYLSGIQMVVGYSDYHSNTNPVFKWWSKCQTKFGPVFKWHSNTGLFSDQTTFDHLNTRLVRYSNPHCICLICPFSYRNLNNVSKIESLGPFLYGPVTKRLINDLNTFFRYSDVIEIPYHLLIILFWYSDPRCNLICYN